ncbi:hypothetical protein GGR51DRAFT_578351 [Nemania sp. FL0031]|nr:hypothetical protein GGR51DRAFT_578351 [Nemania sp. FL0031]
MLTSKVFAIVGWFILGPAAAQLTTATSTSTAHTAQSTACGEIVNSGDFIFRASLVYECMTSVPFNAAVATRFIAYYNDTLQFQSTLAYLKNPRPSYQQNGVDLIEGLGRLQHNVNEGLYGSQYDFETDLMRLLYAAHDGHLKLYAGILATFSFSSPRDIVSVSTDGISPPKVYMSGMWFLHFFSAICRAESALQSINGMDVITYLEQFAANNSVGMLEPHADWNQLMLSPALDILGYYDVFSGSATFYPGDTITFTFENGTSQTEDYLGVYFSQGPTGPLETGGDFYNFFVLGFYPANFDPYGDYGDSDNENEDGSGGSISSGASATSTGVSASSTTMSQPAATTTISGWGNIAYPDVPDVAQPDLGTIGGGYISGYFLRASSIAVLSIPSFDEYGIAVNSFQNTVQEFIQRAGAAGMTKVVIDVQQNTGGQPLLAIDAFQRFFPNVQPFAGSHRINAATGQYFHSWGEFFGPNNFNGDNFTNVQRYNTSDRLFDYESTDETANFTIPSSVAGASPPFAASDIIILSDGICSSSCALFMELMHQEAGVRTVAVGGQPRDGPMQAPSGSRGARQYDINVLDANINFAQLVLQLQNSANATFLPNRTGANDVFILGGSVNLRDQVRRGQNAPLQFSYLPADCRIYYTPQTVFNYTRLWEHAAAAIWTNNSLCVPGSTGHVDSASAGPDGNRTNYVSALDLNGGASNRTAIAPNLIQPVELLDAGAKPRIPYNFKKKADSCYPTVGCGGSGLTCVSQKLCQTADPKYVCLSTCQNLDGPCVGQSGRGVCRATSQTGYKLGSQNVHTGTCLVPPPPCPGQ